MTNPEGGALRWWGDHTLAQGDVGHWQIGPFEFWLARAENEWVFGSRQGDATLDSRCHREVLARGTMPEDDVAVRRLGVRQTSDQIRLTPLLADRSIVIRPAQPIALPSRQELVLYFSSPLWLRVEVDAPLVEFLQAPLQRPSDTWFGPNTREGEICYSLLTSARLQLAELPVRPHRAVTELHIVNQSVDRLPIDRIRVPLPAMSLFATPAGQIWTQVLHFEHHGDDELAELRIGDKPPAHAATARLVAGPREELPRSNFFRSFGGLIGGR